MLVPVVGGCDSLGIGSYSSGEERLRKMINWKSEVRQGAKEGLFLSKKRLQSK